jgi:drug/metabolite transporter (DMT)-like permease
MLAYTTSSQRSKCENREFKFVSCRYLICAVDLPGYLPPLIKKQTIRKSERLVFKSLLRGERYSKHGEHFKLRLQDPSTQSPWLGYAAILGAAATLAVAPLITKILVPRVEPLMIATWRTMLSLPLLAVALALFGSRLPNVSSDWATALMGGIAMVAVPFGALSLGQVYITSNMGGILYGATPLMVAGLGWVLLKHERAGWRELVGSVMGIVGIGLLLGPNLQQGVTAFGSGQLITLIGPLSYAIGTVILRRRPPVEALSLTAGMYLISSFLLLLGSVIQGRLIIPALQDLAVLCVLAGLGSVVPTIFMYLSIKIAGATRASFAMLILPFFSLLYGALFLGEQPTGLMISGAAVLIAGCAFSILSRGLHPSNSKT